MDTVENWSQAFGEIAGMLGQIGSTILTLLPGALVGAVLTYLVALRQLKLKRYMDATNSFIDIAGHAHGYPRGDRAGRVGLAEQTAAIWLIVELANEFRFLRVPARKALGNLNKIFSNSEAEGYAAATWTLVAEEAEEALKAVKQSKRPFIRFALSRLTRGRFGSARV